MDAKKYCRIIRNADSYTYFGKIDKVIGMMIESNGPECKVGDLCRIYGQGNKRFISAEVVGFRG